jgi:hypothetical protein
MKRFMITLRGQPSEWNKLPETEQTRLIHTYMAWVEKLKKENGFQGGSEMDWNARELRTVNGKIVVDGPFPETKEILTGYFIISADSLDSAVETAKGCPALTHGDTVVVAELPVRN